MFRICVHLTLLMALLWVHVPSVSQKSLAKGTTLYGAIVRGDTSQKELALVFTGDQYGEGGGHIIRVLREQGIKGSFFLTGNFYRNPEFEDLVRQLIREDHYMGAHSDQHLLYCDWVQRDSLLVRRDQFEKDLLENYSAMAAFGIEYKDAPYLLPPYEWYNAKIAAWTRDLGLQLINLSYGTLSHADYTLPGTTAYRDSQEIFDSILEYEATHAQGLQGFILLSHIGTLAERADKFYLYLDPLISELKKRGYRFKRVDELLAHP